jgi:hypothetical protein
MDVQISMVFAGVNWQEKNLQIVSTDSSKIILPSTQWNDNYQLALKHIVDTYVKLDMAWIQPELVDVVGENDSLTIYYSSIIPFDTPLTKAYWVLPGLEHTVLNRLVCKIGNQNEIS